MAWTDDELRAAIHEAASKSEYRHLVISHKHDPGPDNIKVDRDGLADLRRILTALGIDHQPKPELPTHIGVHIRDVVFDGGATCEVMTLDKRGDWIGINQDGDICYGVSAEITSWRPLSLEALEEGDGDE